MTAAPLENVPKPLASDLVFGRKRPNAVPGKKPSAPSVTRSRCAEKPRWYGGPKAMR